MSRGLAHSLEHLRQTIWNQVGVECRITVQSGFRCKPWNEECGGVPGSQHLLGLAADISVERLDPHEVAAIAKAQQNFGGIGEYGTFVHLDVGPSGRTWDFSGIPDRDVLHDVRE